MQVSPVSLFWGWYLFCFDKDARQQYVVCCFLRDSKVKINYLMEFFQHCHSVAQFVCHKDILIFSKKKAIYSQWWMISYKVITASGETFKRGNFEACSLLSFCAVWDLENSIFWLKVVFVPFQLPAKVEPMSSRCLTLKPVPIWPSLPSCTSRCASVLTLRRSSVWVQVRLVNCLLSHSQSCNGNEP